MDEELLPGLENNSLATETEETHEVQRTDKGCPTLGVPHFTNLAVFFLTLFKTPLPPPLPFEYLVENICRFYAITI